MNIATTPATASPPDTEQVQLEKMNKLRQLTQLILLRHSLLLLAVLAVSAGALTAFLRWRGAKSPSRFTAEMELLYQPKEIKPFIAIDDHAMLQLMARKIVTDKTDSIMMRNGLGRLERDSITIQKQRNQNHLFRIITTGGTAGEAILKANAFADICIDEYREFRRADLKRWTEVFTEQYALHEEKLRQYAQTIANLLKEAGQNTPQSEQQRLTDLLTEQRQTLAQLHTQLANAKAKAAKLRLLAKALPIRALPNASKIKDFHQRLDDLDKDIIVMGQLYTDKNPKLLALKAQRDSLQQTYKLFLEREKLPDISPEALDAAKRLVQETAEAEAEIETISANAKVLEQAIADNEGHLKAIADIIPKLSELQTLQNGVRNSLAETEKTLTDLQYLTISANKELQPIEYASQATAKPLLSKKALAGIVIISAFLTFMAAVVLFFLELLFGHVRTYAELSAYYGLLPFGMLPVKPDSYTSSNAGRYALNEIYYKLHELDENAHVLFIGRLPGTTLPATLHQTLVWQSATNGRRMLILRIVPSKTFVETDSMTQLNAVSYEGSFGYMPVDNPYTMSNSELSLFKEDLKTLQQHFELILITREEPLSRHGLLFSQMFRLADYSFILTAAHKTPRTALRLAISLHQKLTDRPLGAVMVSRQADDLTAHQPTPPRMSPPGTQRLNLARNALSSLAAVLLSSGCYNRYTSNFNEYPTLEESHSAIVDHRGMSEADLAAQLAELKRIDATPMDEYRINAGDNIAIVVYNHPDLSITTVVTPDGYIGLVFAGQLKVAGLTLKEAADTITKSLQDYIKNPAVGVSPVKINSQTASIAGAVKQPGMYNISNDMRLTDLFAQAGGAAARYYDGQTLDAADLKNSLFVRNGDIIPIDFFKAIEQGDKWHNLKLRKGDYVYIAVRSESMVCLIGEVNTPHKRLWDKNLGLLELLATGGHLKDNHWQYAIIIRGGVSNPAMYRVDLDAILQGRSPNIYLEPGDIVYVPKDDISEFNVFVRKLLPTPQLIQTLFGRTIITY